jgi:hypothetical protein
MVANDSACQRGFIKLEISNLEHSWLRLRSLFKETNLDATTERRVQKGLSDIRDAIYKISSFEE